VWGVWGDGGGIFSVTTIESTSLRFGKAFC
jgi:hypothetical protein